MAMSVYVCVLKTRTFWMNNTGEVMDYECCIRDAKMQRRSKSVRICALCSISSALKTDALNGCDRGKMHDDAHLLTLPPACRSAHRFNCYHRDFRFEFN